MLYLGKTIFLFKCILAGKIDHMIPYTAYEKKRRRLGPFAQECYYPTDPQFGFYCPSNEAEMGKFKNQKYFSKILFIEYKKFYKLKALNDLQKAQLEGL